MSQITLMTGSNVYAMQKEKRRWIHEFALKHGIENFLEFDASKISYKELCNEVQTAPFIADKRLFIIEGVPKGKKEDIDNLINCMHPNVLLLFILEMENSKKAKMSVAASAIAKIASVRQFPSITNAQLIAWIKEIIILNGAEGIEKDALSFLLENIGDNQEMMESELKKFALYAYGRKISLEDVLLLSTSLAEREAWKIMDYIGSGKPGNAALYAESLLDRGYSPQALWSTFLWMVSLFTQVVALVESGETDAWKITNALHARLSSIRSLLPYAKTIQKKQLLRILDIVIQADIGLKTGEYRAPADSQEELLVLIDTSMMAFSK